jgi:hypothetical protein
MVSSHVKKHSHPLIPSEARSEKEFNNLILKVQDGLKAVCAHEQNS